MCKLGIFAFNIHESIKEDFIKNLQQQTKSQGMLFAILILLTFTGLLGTDMLLGWSSLLILSRVVPIVFAFLYIIYSKFLNEKFIRFFNLIYSAFILSVIFSAAVTLYQVFTLSGAAPINKLGCAFGLALAMLTCFLFAGIAVISFLWLIGVPMLFAMVGVFLHGHAGIYEWSMLAIPIAVFAILALLSGEQFLLRTKLFAVQRRNQMQSNLLDELKLSFKGLREENLFLVEQLKSNSTFDSLTSVFNKPAGLELLEKEFYFAQRNSEPMTIAFVKINNIPWFTTEYGQEFANKVILTIIQILKETVRKSDLIVRYATDDFLIIFRQCEANAAKKVVSRAKSRAAGLSSQSDIEVTFNTGFADTGHVEFTTAVQMIEVAQREMFIEKEKAEIEPESHESAVPPEVVPPEVPPPLDSAAPSVADVFDKSGDDRPAASAVAEVSTSTYDDEGGMAAS